MSSLAFVLAVLLAWSSVTWASPQSDALALQQVAVTRLKGLTAEFRRTFDVKPLLPALLQTDTELTQSSQALREAGDDVGLAVGLIKRGDVGRMMENYSLAANLYAQAAAAARRGGNSGHEADAMSAKSVAEMNGGRIDQAASDAERAVQLALPLGHKDALSRAYGTLTRVHDKRKNLSAGEAASKLEFAAANASGDGVAVYAAYVHRGNLRFTALRECDLGGDVIPCFESLDAARADYEAARAIAAERAYPAMASAMSKLLICNARIRANIEARGDKLRALWDSCE